MFMPFKVIKRSFITLIEIMIVMFIIALITGVIAYNYTGSLEEAKAFKTQAGIEKVQTILQLAVASNPGLMTDLPETWKGVISRSPLVQNPQSLTQDGWGYDYEVSVNDGTVVVFSRKYDEYRGSRSTMFNKQEERTQ